jgi:hypothetical protein
MPEQDEDPLENTRYRIDPDLESHGEYDPVLNLLTFHPDHLDDPTVLREMIHVYENYFDKAPQIKEFWITRFYRRLKPEIRNLDGYCVQFGLMDADVREELGGIHSIFFLLKSFDLDLKLGLESGTILGYERLHSFD